jgi:glycosyltransferase involved in cell wall biosynthesis
VAAVKVSVVIPVFNGETTIAGTLESVFAQRFDGGFEVVVVNDGSTDGTHSVLEKYGDRIRVIEQENRGISAARNAGLKVSAGEYIALLDADDTWTEDKLEKTVPVLQENPKCVAVFSDATVVKGPGRILFENYIDACYAHSPTLDEMLSVAWPILPSATVVRRETLLEIGGFPEEFGKEYGAEDTFAFLLLRERGEIHFVADKLLRYRISEVKDYFAKRIRADRDSSGPGGDVSADLERSYAGNLVFARLIRHRFGTRGRRHVRSAIAGVGRGLVSLGLMAIHEGDRALAIRYYRASLRYRPIDPKTYVRMAWAALPAEITGKFTGILTPRLRRSLSGPPTTLHDRPQRI